MIKTFVIKDEFYLNNEPMKIISGAIHYFRVVPEYWQDRLEKLKAMGCNTVETYIPWNFHEPQEGRFKFDGLADIRTFVKTAENLDLHVILRPSPYICAEWEFGGLPYWLLNYPIKKLRFYDKLFLEKYERFFQRLMKEIGDLQITAGGPVLMMQVENEYGSFANDKKYLHAIANMMKKNGVEVPLFTSDGPWGDLLRNGSVPEIALPTINCGSDIASHFETLKTFNGEKKPLMVMEYWIGWFDAWEKDHITTDFTVPAKHLADCLKEGSVNFYMFHGGTNFGFNNGANYYERYYPQSTSYDYDAPLTEWGDITPKYEAFQKVIGQFVEIPKIKWSTSIKKIAYGEIECTEKVSLFSTIKKLAKPIQSSYPLTMEELNQGTGYVYYVTNLGESRWIDEFKLINCKDRAHTFLDEKLLFTKYETEMEKPEKFSLNSTQNQLGILVENMGRVNYGPKILHQRKGIVDGVVINGAMQSEWTQYSLPLDNIHEVDFEGKWEDGIPGFYKFEVEVEEIGDTFIDMKGWGKGVVFINNFNLGRFWEVGAQEKLYLPGPLLKKGKNEIIIFETEGKQQTSIQLIDNPSLWKK